jgi:hypothetical protein
MEALKIPEIITILAKMSDGITTAEKMWEGSERVPGFKTVLDSPEKIAQFTKIINLEIAEFKDSKPDSTLAQEAMMKAGKIMLGNKRKVIRVGNDEYRGIPSVLNKVQ